MYKSLVFRALYIGVVMVAPAVSGRSLGIEPDDFCNSLSDKRSKVEAAICSDSGLEELNIALQYIYRGKMHSLSADAKKLLKASQLRWLKERDKCGADIPCLIDSTSKKILELRIPGPLEVGPLKFAWIPIKSQLVPQITAGATPKATDLINGSLKGMVILGARPSEDGPRDFGPRSEFRVEVKNGILDVQTVYETFGAAPVDHLEHHKFFIDNGVSFPAEVVISNGQSKWGLTVDVIYRELMKSAKEHLNAGKADGCDAFDPKEDSVTAALAESGKFLVFSFDPSARACQAFGWEVKVPIARFDKPLAKYIKTIAAGLAEHCKNSQSVECKN